MNIRWALRKLGSDLGGIHLGLDKKRRCQIKLEDDITIMLQATTDEKTVVMSVKVSPYPKKHLEGVLTLLLAANMFGQGTNGAAFAVDRKHKTTLFCRILKMPKISYKIFRAALVDAAEQVRVWRSRIKRVEKHGSLVPENKIEYFWRKI